MRTRIAATLIMLAALLAASAASAASWRIDPGRTHIAFSIDAVGYPRTEGKFRRFDGRISVDFDHPERSSVAFHVKSDSVDVGSSSFGDYIRSSAFLDSEHFPSIDFVSTAVQKLNEHTVRVSGDLTLLGVTRPLTVDVVVSKESAGQRLDFQAQTTINRLEFGMKAGFPLVGNAIGLTVSSAAAVL